MIFTGHNVNNLARIKPTAKGLEIIRNERAKYRRLAPQIDWSTYLRPDANGYIEIPLWQVMETFGAYMQHSADPVFETDFLLQETPR